LRTSVQLKKQDSPKANQSRRDKSNAKLNSHSMFANQPFQLEPLLRHASSDAATQSREIVICRCFGDPASRFNSLILIVLFIVMTLCYETAPTLNRNRLSRSRALCMNPNIEEDSFPQSKRGIVHPCLKEGGCWRASAVPLACPGGWKPAPPPWPQRKDRNTSSQDREK
jgi:hypothetical protein